MNGVINAISHIPLGTLVTWIIIGLIAGTLVDVVDEKRRVHGGLLGTVVFGMLGAFIGGLLARMALGVSYQGISVGGFLSAVIGAFLLAFISRLLFQKPEQIEEQKQREVEEKPRYAYVGTKGGQATYKREDHQHHIVNPIQVEKYLRHVDYPANKETLEETAKREGADDDILYTLEQMEGEKFNGPVDVSRAIGKLT